MRASLPGNLIDMILRAIGLSVLNKVPYNRDKYRGLNFKIVKKKSKKHDYFLHLCTV